LIGGKFPLIDGPDLGIPKLSVRQCPIIFSNEAAAHN
jgi:hypothetical protein